MIFFFGDPKRKRYRNEIVVACFVSTSLYFEISHTQSLLKEHKRRAIVKERVIQGPAGAQFCVACLLDFAPNLDFNPLLKRIFYCDVSNETNIGLVIYT